MIFHGQILNFGSLKLKDRIGKKKGERRKKNPFRHKKLKVGNTDFLGVGTVGHHFNLQKEDNGGRKKNHYVKAFLSSCDSKAV